MQRNAVTLGRLAPDAGWGEEEPIDSFALVTYIPAPFGEFLDDLRRELVPNYIPRAHVTILPPRPLGIEAQAAWEYVYSRIATCPPFVIEATRPVIFRSTSVIFLDLGKGLDEIAMMHDILNTGPTAAAEPFAYHPHITLAQGVTEDELPAMFGIAKRRWAAYNGEKSFRVGTVTLVQNTASNTWRDLAQCHLGVPAAR